MALQKSKELTSGVTGEYWRVGMVILDRMLNTAVIRADLFKDAAARTAGKTELLYKTYEFSSVSIVETQAFDDIIAWAYDKLKGLPDFTDAADV